MRGKSQVVVVVACLALTGCAAAMQYTVTADLFIQPSRVLQGNIFDIGGPSPAFTPPTGPSSEAPTMPGQPAEIPAGRLLRLWVCRACSHGTGRHEYPATRRRPIREPLLP